MSPYPVAWPVGQSQHDQQEDVLECLGVARRLVRQLGCDQLAGIVIEPAQGTAGNLFPPFGFLEGLRELADDVGALLIFDEIITGFGRTGQLFISGSSGLTPDIVIIGKGMGNGVPVSGLVTTEAIGCSLPFAGPSGSSSSYGGNPLSAAAAGATLKILQQESLTENSRQVGIEFRNRLTHSLGGSPMVRGPWGAGLLIGLELVSPRSGKPLGQADCERIFRMLLTRGVLVAAYNPRVRINPPLCLTATEATFAADAIAEVLNEPASLQ
jgi:4-aminobutyrate aminotransferase-like enzyme